MYHTGTRDPSQKSLY